MNPMDKITNLLIDAITASGKKFNQIDKNSIFEWLKNQGVSKNKFESVYQSLSNFYNKDLPTNSVSMSKDVVVGSVVDYSDSSHNDVKVRQPRKSVFSEIKKVAG